MRQLHLLSRIRRLLGRAILTGVDEERRGSPGGPMSDDELASAIRECRYPNSKDPAAGVSQRTRKSSDAARAKKTT
jgi:hypothetical protein